MAYGAPYPGGYPLPQQRGCSQDGDRRPLMNMLLADGPVRRRGRGPDRCRLPRLLLAPEPQKLVQKISAGEIALALVRMEASERCAKGVHLVDLAKWIDERARRPARNAGSSVARKPLNEALSHEISILVC